jgi:hypothetical protein
MAVPNGVIAMWSGTLASIPANWVLCDGNNSTPNLVAKFIRGAPAGSEAGGTGGADSHTHASMGTGGHTHTLGARTHTHTVSSSGNHTHFQGCAPYNGADQQAPWMYVYAGYGAHQHTTDTGTSSHTHTSAASTHTHTISTNDSRPPYYEVAYIMSNGSASVATGLIIIWSGTLATIPTGWDLCDGSSGRPNLRSKFVRGVNTSVTNPGTTGGATTHVHTEGDYTGTHTHAASDSQGAHTHNFSAYTWTHSHNLSGSANSTGNYTTAEQTDSGAGNHTHATSSSTGAHTHTLAAGGATHSHTVDSSSNLPSYYDVAFIYNTSAASLPTGAVFIWTGLIANIPTNYTLCNGASSTPDLRSKFLRGSDAGVNPGGAGGADTHYHTDQNADSHSNHTVSSSGAHQHSATDSIGSHSHSYTNHLQVDDWGWGYYAKSPYSPSGGAHSHTYTNQDAHTNHTVSTSTHNHSNYSTDSGLPNYYQVQFICFTPVAPTVTTQAVTSIGATTATGNGNITNTGGTNATVRGIQWDTHTHVGGAYANDIHEHGDYGTGAFTISLTGLPTGTLVYCRAYATNSVGTSYGDEVTFIPGSPTVTTQAATSIGATTATGNGNITNTGGVNATVRGIQWDVHTHVGGAYANDIHEHGDFSAGAFTISLTGLPANTLTYCRAYATNPNGTGYGDEVTFTTGPNQAGIIAMWSGTLASIPANWVLCDGNNGTPNLVAKFIKGAAASTEAGTTGGSDTHTHASMTAAGSHTHSLGARTHTHTVNSAGNHAHSPGAYPGGPFSNEIRMAVTTGAHQHTTTTGTSSHTHTSTDSGTHTHAISTDDGRPPYYEIAFVMSNSSASIATGIIIIWSGTLANIPTGWALCNGTSNPDLRAKFIRGVNTNVTNPGTIGGATTHNHTETAAAHTHDTDSQGAHTHGFSAYTWTHQHNENDFYGDYVNGVYSIYQQTDTGDGDHTHATSSSNGAHTHTLNSGGSHSHTVDASSSLPAYYDVAFIISTSATSVPLNGILIWTGLLANIPVGSGFSLCDGSSAKPDLRGKYIRGSAASVDPGGTGGANTHYHTDQNNATHSDHTVAAGGIHQHSATNSIGNHSHTADSYPDSYTYSGMDRTSKGAHSHTYNNEDDHTNHTVGSASAVHNHSNYSTDNGEPAYYTVQFIQSIGTYPTVTTQAATSVGATTATGNGTIVSTGGINATVRGIQWDTHDGGTFSYDVHEHGDFSAGAFTIPLTGLPASTLIYCRAYATNPIDTVYGATVTFTTITQNVKYWSGGSWTLPTTIKYWSGASWTDILAGYYWSGGTWTKFYG